LIVLRQAVVKIGKPKHLDTLLLAVCPRDMLYDTNSLTAAYDLAMPTVGAQPA
jgi:hypothetical protein